VAALSEVTAGMRTGYNTGVFAGNQALLSLDVPVSVEGNAVGALGVATAVGYKVDEHAVVEADAELRPTPKPTSF